MMNKYYSKNQELKKFNWKLIELSNFINKVVEKIKENSQNHNMLTKIQNILKDTKVDQHLLNCFHLNVYHTKTQPQTDKKREHSINLIVTVCRFFKYFVLNNVKNQQEMQSHFRLIMDQGKHGIKISNLISIILKVNYFTIRKSKTNSKSNTTLTLSLNTSNLSLITAFAL